MKLTTSSLAPVYTIAGEGTSRPLPEWLARKRKRSLKKDAEYASRVELLQDFEFEEASECVRVSEDGEWVVSTGTYKPQIHVHNLSQLALSYSRHTNTINQTFRLLDSDYSKSLHLQTDRSLEFHTPGGLHYSTRIPRYGRDLVYNRRTAEAIIPAVGIGAEGMGEVFRLNMEVGRFMRGYEVDVGGDDLESYGACTLQGGIGVGAVNCAAVAEQSHGLLAFGTSKGTVEFWDSRSRTRISTLSLPPSTTSLLDTGQDLARTEVTALDFHASGLFLATGTSTGIIQTYDLRSPIPLWKKDQGYGERIQNLDYLTPPITSSSNIISDRLLSSDRKSIKIFDSDSGDLYTSISPAVDLNHVEWVPNTGMLLTANEGRQQHAFLIPSLGPAPRWCSFLDNLVEEMAEDANADPQSYSRPTAGGAVGEVYDNYRFVDQKELRDLNLEHLPYDERGKGVLRPYMHGYFVPQRLYEQARLLANPDLAIQQRQKSIREKIDKERESRIRGNKKVQVKVNRKFAEKLAAREEANERRKAQRLLRRQGTGAEDNDAAGMVEEPVGQSEPAPDSNENAPKRPQKSTTDLMEDGRFKGLFEDEDFEIDETSREFQLHNPSSTNGTNGREQSNRKGLTAVEEEDLDGRAHSSDDDDDDEDDNDDHNEEDTTTINAQQRQRRHQTEYYEDADQRNRIGNSSYKKSGHTSRNNAKQKDQHQKAGPRMLVSTSSVSKPKPHLRQQEHRGRAFGDLATALPSRGVDDFRQRGSGRASGGIVGEQQVSFVPSKKSSKEASTTVGDGGRDAGRGQGGSSRAKGRRSASGNVMRQL